MRLSTFATVLAVFVTYAWGWDTTTSSTPSIIMTLPPTTICPAITQTGGSGCPASPTGCTIADCIIAVSITQPCDCPDGLPTSTFCETTCHQGCQTTTSILRLPCPTSISSSTSSSSSSTIASSSSSSSSTSCTDASCSSTSLSSTSQCTDASCTTSQSSTTTSLPPYSNSTVTVITTLTTCPYQDRCHGQTTTWTGTEGPFPCSARPTCTCVLPGNSGTTITGPTTTPASTTTQVTTVGGGGAGGSKTSSGASSTGTGSLQGSGAERVVAEGWVGMVIAGLLGLL